LSDFAGEKIDTGPTAISVPVERFRPYISIGSFNELLLIGFFAEVGVGIAVAVSCPLYGTKPLGGLSVRGQP
jgi:hypothetical protein